MRGKFVHPPDHRGRERAHEHEHAERAADREAATPARRNTVTNASTVVITHTVVWMRPTGTPSVAARSTRSADARIAMPTRV